MAGTNEFVVQQLVDNGKAVQISLVENVTTEPISQKQMIKESVSKLDSETRDQIMPLLDAILRAQPTIKMKSYQNTAINVTMPKQAFERLGSPQVGDIVSVDMHKR